MTTTIQKWTKDFKGRIYYHGKQKEAEWLHLRKGRVTASVAYEATGKKKPFKREISLLSTTREPQSPRRRLADKILGIISPEDSSEDSLNSIMYEKHTTIEMQIGIESEDAIRTIYEEHSGSSVREVAFIIWLKYPKLGVSPDGLIGTNGMLEIKAPWIMYKPLSDVLTALAEGLPDPRLHSSSPVWKGRPNHIWYSHYSQMQMQMAIAGRSWCDYVVCAVSEEVIYIERIPFNGPYWEWLLKYLIDFCDDYLQGTDPYMPDIINIFAEENV